MDTGRGRVNGKNYGPLSCGNKEGAASLLQIKQGGNREAHAKRGRLFKGNFVFNKNSTLSPKTRILTRKVHHNNADGTNPCNEDIGMESLTQPAISSRITEARYDENQL